MNEAPPKRCPLCREPVHPEAKKCPHCQHFLNKWVLMAYHPLAAMLPMVICITIGGAFLGKIFDKGEDFERYRSQVQIEGSEFQFGELKGGPTVAIIGTIRNGSKIGWKSVTLEAKVFDKARKLVDTKQSRQWADEVSVPAGGSAAFKISWPREFEAGNYASHEVRVVDARDRRGFLQ